MNYIIQPFTESSPSCVILERSLSFRGIIPLLCKGLGTLLLLISLVFLASGTLPQFQMFAFFVMGMGFFCLSLGQVFVGYRHMPSRFVFDNQASLLKIENASSSFSLIKAHLSYLEIRDFQVRRMSEPKGAGRQNVYVVEMIKKDGAFWCIYRSLKREQAEEFCSTLKTHVHFHQKRVQKIPNSTYSAGQIKLEEGEKSTRLCWRERSSLRGGMAMLFVCCGLLVCLLPFRTYIPVSLQSIISSVLALFALFGAGQILLYFRQTHSIEITKEQMHYTPFTETEDDALANTAFKIDNRSIDTILFNFSLSQKEPTLYILKKGETSRLLKLKRGQDGPVRSQTISRILRHIYKIDAHELSFAEQLHLENALQDIIQKRSGHHVA